MKHKISEYFLFAMLSISPFAQAENDSLKSQLDTPLGGETEPRVENEYRILFVGDSITRHGTNASVKKKLGWGHVAGMAASTEANDYVHQFVGRVEKARPENEVTIFFHTAGGGGSVAQRLNAFDKVENVNPDLVIIQLGEHEKRQNGTDQLRKDFANLVKRAKSFSTQPTVICVGPWSPTNATSKSQYNGWAGEVESVMQSVCEAQGVSYVSIREVAENPINSGWGESPGVRWHPNDGGHAGYAELLFEAYSEQSK